MSETVIRVENLGKKYVIDHAGDKTRHNSLRDSLTAGVKGFARRLFGRGQTTGGASKEEFWALKDVNFEVKRGEVVGVIGRNGAGKSTLLKLLSQITQPTTGQIELDGRVASLLEVGTGFHPELTGRENVFLNGAILGMSRAEIRRKFDEIVAFAEVEKFLDTPVKRYSSGMYMRLAFAVAAHLEPEILIVDEVLAVGDASFQKKCLGKMSEVARDGRTVLFVSHNMIAVSQLCTKGLLLKAGRIDSMGLVAECISRLTESNNSGVVTGKRAGADLGRQLQVEKVDATLAGEQPDHLLRVEVQLQTKERHRPCSIAIDVVAADGTTVSQSMPTASTCISGDIGGKHLSLELRLHGLVPGDYQLRVWVGTLGIETLDEIAGCADFTVTNSPIIGRLESHQPKYGYFSPACTIRDPTTTSETSEFSATPEVVARSLTNWQAL